MDWTLEDLAALKTALKTGARRVEYQDKTVEYRTLAEMLAILALIKGELGLLKARPTRYYAATSKGVR